jgi:hypothetical protein
VTAILLNPGFCLFLFFLILVAQWIVEGRRIEAARKCSCCRKFGTKESLAISLGK